MTHKWIGLSAVLTLVSLIAPAGMRGDVQLDLRSRITGRVLAASDDGPCRTAAHMGDAPGQPTGSTFDFGLVSETEGWISSGPALYRTATGGQTWRDISPLEPSSAAILAAFFLDASRGWAVTPAQETAGPGDLVLFRTIDGGTTWDSTALRLLPRGPQAAPAGAVYLHFIDDRTGWLVIKHVSSSNFSLGTLFKTSDGGRTWTQAAMPIGEPVYFATDDVGWTAGGATGQELYRTADGGESWQAQNVAPGPTPDGRRRFYRLPRFWNEQEGLLPVVAVGEDARLEVYVTSDTGASWELTAAAPLAPGTTFADGLPFALIPSARAAMIVLDEDRVVTASDRGAVTSPMARPETPGELTRLEMATTRAGWALQSFGTCSPASSPAGAPPGSQTGPECRSETRLLGTTDGGHTWTALPLPAIVSPAAITEPGRRSAEGPTPGGTTGPWPDIGGRTAAFAGQGFDKCEVASTAQLGKWITESPYRAVNLYIGGAARACSNAALSASLLSQLSELGWQFIPTWVGPQAPCVTSVKLRMSPDPAVARAQGISEANAAADVAAGLGLARPDGSGSIVYYDMEYYDTSNAACHEAVRAFVTGWSEQIHARGGLAGVYATGAPLSTFTTLSDVPDAIWPANWVFSSYNPDATVWDVYRLSNDLWSDHQRMRQYTGGHVETWGSVSLNIDCDVIDGIVANIRLPEPTFAVYLPLTLNHDSISP
jgi:photosystem II stability/assembly factor-like uncharacterized protein